MALNLPAFNPNNVKLWIIQMQVIFNARKIVSQRACYCYIIEKLPAEVAKEVTDLLETMLKEILYDTLKNKSINLM